MRARTVSATLPIRLVSEQNQREHWSVKAKRTKAQKQAVGFLLRPCLAGDVGRGSQPLLVTITRIAPRRLDDDNATGSAKHVRDAVAELLGVDDGSDAVTWRVEQEKGPYGCRIRIEARP